MAYDRAMSRGARRVYDRHAGARDDPSQAFGSKYDLVALAVPAVVLLIVVMLQTLVWLIAGYGQTSGFGAVELGFFGLLILVPLYVPYIAGFVAARTDARARGQDSAAQHFALLLIVGLTSAAISMAFHSVAATALLIVLVVVPAIAGTASLGARALSERARTSPKILA
jgi:hypothetical protein